MRSGWPRSALLLGIVALLLYTPAFWWGAPHATAADRTNAWGVDDEPPLGPLAQAHDIIAPKAEMNPNLGYPMLHPFMVLGSFAPYIGYLAATGGLEKPTVAYPHGFDDPVAALKHLTWIAHFLSVLLGVGIVICAYGIAREMWDETTGVVAAIFAMLVYPMFYYARNSNVDVPVLFFTAAGLWAFALIAKRGLTTRRAVVLGALVGCAVATKEPSFASFAFVPLVLPFMRDPGERERYWMQPGFWRTATLATAAALGAYAIGSGLVIDFARWQAHLTFIRERTQLARSGGVIFTTYYPFTWSGHVSLAAQIVALLGNAMSLPGLALGIGGLILAARRNRRSVLLAYSALVYLVILFVSARVIQLRYVLPITFVLALYAGYAVVTGWRSIPTIRWATAAVAGAAVIILALWATDLTYGMVRDSRYAAGAWIARNARPGDALEYFGSEHKHPPMPASLTSRQAIPFRGSTFRADTGATAIQTIIDGWRERRPRFVALVPDYTSYPGAPHAATCPPAIYRALEDGSLGYRRVAFFQTRPLLPWARRPALDHPVVNPPIRIYERVVGP
ncbi:MAG TPA: glycosyltransferase family 39 protein [Gemmatimonadaceae bacterium]|nr:glycosyltransferase family 39 protein [Gemmatimonadaceae bacterium]